MVSTTNPSRIRLLVFAEGATLAHVARPLALTAPLDPAKFDVILACPKNYQWATTQYPWPVIDLNTQDSAIFIQRLATGRPLYSLETLESYIEEDLRLIQQHQPDIVLGDFRLSLAISSRKRQIPYVTLSNAYWSPSYRVPMPTMHHPVLDRLPASLARILFKASYPFASFWHARAINLLRKRHGLPTGQSLNETYTDADIVALCDWPHFYANEQFPDNHQFLGPVIWSPPVALPDWWPQLRHDKPLIYITLGSSGNPKQIDIIIQGLSGQGYQLAVATAGIDRQDLKKYPDVYWAPYLPGDILSKRADLIICNGGSLTTQQALMEGKPVLGIPHNLDQLLNMQCIEQHHYGVKLRANECTEKQITDSVTKMLRVSSDTPPTTSAMMTKSPDQWLTPILIGLASAPINKHR